MDNKNIDYDKLTIDDVLMKCTRCSHVWLIKNIGVKPARCPNGKCNSPYWNRVKTIFKKDKG